MANDLRLNAATREITLQRGERISLSFSYTYSIEAFRWVLTAAGWKILHEYPSPDGRYVHRDLLARVDARYLF